MDIDTPSFVYALGIVNLFFLFAFHSKLKAEKNLDVTHDIGMRSKFSKNGQSQRQVRKHGTRLFILHICESNSLLSSSRSSGVKCKNLEVFFNV